MNLFVVLIVLAFGVQGLNNIALDVLDNDLKSDFYVSQALTMIGASASNYNGNDVSKLGDFNNDGYDDIATSSFGFEENKGRVYVFWGKNGDFHNKYLPDQHQSVPESEGFILDGEYKGDYAGYSVCGADMNNDGYMDLVIGAIGAADSTGKVYVLFGHSGMSQASLTLSDSLAEDGLGFVILGEDTRNAFGYSVRAAGDVNDDGYPDIIVGAPLAKNEENSTDAFVIGKAYVIFGGPTLSNMKISDDSTWRGFVIEGFQEEGHCGVSVDAAGDLNDDGFDDVVVGCPYARNEAGAAYVIYGHSTMPKTIVVSSFTDLSVGFAVTGGASSYVCGLSVSKAGDMNGDGVDDVLIAAPGFTVGAFPFSGAAMIIFGSKTPGALQNINLVPSIGKKPPSTMLLLTTRARYQYCGHGVAAVGDVNGDGECDVIVGHGDNATVVYGGKANLALHTNNLVDLSTLPSNLGATIIGQHNSTSFLTVASAGDVNGDKVNDIFVGNTNWEKYQGISYIVFGTPAVDGTTSNGSSKPPSSYSFAGLVVAVPLLFACCLFCGIGYYCHRKSRGGVPRDEAYDGMIDNQL